jgi:hypothetical protein
MTEKRKSRIAEVERHRKAQKHKSREAGKAEKQGKQRSNESREPARNPQKVPTTGEKTQHQ